MAANRVLIGDPGAPAFLAGWSNYGQGYEEAGYVKTGDGIVHLFGVVNAIQTPLVGIFQLPAGYRPDRRLVFPVNMNGNLVGRVDVLPHSDATYPGLVLHVAGPAGQPPLIANGLSLAGVSFLAVA